MWPKRGKGREGGSGERRGKHENKIYGQPNQTLIVIRGGLRKKKNTGLFGNFCREICNMIFQKLWGGGQRPFGTFPKIHPFSSLSKLTDNFKSGDAGTYKKF